MIAIGIDPGLTGAIAVLCSRAGMLDVQDIPTCGNGTESGSMRKWVDHVALSNLLARWSTRFSFASEDVHSFIERPIPMPSLPAQTIASQFDSFGVLRAAAPGVQHIVNPRDWKAIYGLKSDKDAARACAMRLYSDAPVKRVKDHNRAEALLIAHFGLVELNG